MAENFRFEYNSISTIELVEGEDEDEEILERVREPFTVEYVEEPEVGGFAHEFIDEVLPGQECTVCLLPMREAVQTACGHRFCRICLKKSIRTNNSVCPTCRDPIDSADEFYRDIAWSRDILSLRVKCQVSGRGCEWTGEVRHAEEHQVKCLFADVTCDKCEAVFERRHQQIHLTEQCPCRFVECAFCKKPLPHYFKPVWALQ